MSERICTLCGCSGGDMMPESNEHRLYVDCATALRTRLAAAEAERDRYRSALRDVVREWPYLDLIDPQTAQECDLRGLVEYLLSALRSEQCVAREALEGPSDA